MNNSVLKHNKSLLASQLYCQHFAAQVLNQSNLFL